MPSLAARTVLCSAAALVVVVGWQAATVYANDGGDWSALFYTGDFMRLPADVAAEQPYRFPASPGYDGAFYHMLAHAPSMPGDTRASIDNPPLRWRRILVPFLAFAAALRDRERIDSAYIAVVDMFVALGTAALVLFLSREGIGTAWSLLFLVVPAVLVSLDRMTVDAALAALVVVFAVAEGPILWFAAALAPLVRANQVARLRTPDVIYVPTPQNIVEAMLELARVGPADVVYDLGSGDGRVVIVAAQKYHARGVGIEIVPHLVDLSRQIARQGEVADKVTFVEGDLFETDLSRATVVTLCLSASVNAKLESRLRGLRPGTRIVSRQFPIGDWVPDRKIRAEDGSDLFLWIVPARSKRSGRT